MTDETNLSVQAWDNAGRPHPYATFRDGYAAANRQQRGEAVAWEVTNDACSFWTAMRDESKARALADEQRRAGWPGAEVRPLGYIAAPQPAEPVLTRCGLCHNMRTLDPHETPAEPVVNPSLTTAEPAREPSDAWALVEKYADAVSLYNEAVRIDVGVDKAGQECLAIEKDLRALLSRYGQPAASAEPWKPLWDDIMGFAEDAHTPTATRMKEWAWQVRRLTAPVAAPVAQAQDASDAVRAWQEYDAACDWANHLARTVLKYFHKDIGAPDSGYDAWTLARNIIKTAAPYAPIAAQPDGMVNVTQQDANNYCRILSLLGMEEEGDPVAEVERLVAASEAQEPLSPADHLLSEAHKYWKYANAKHYGAVQWIHNEETGALLIFTRGEYKETLMRNIMDTQSSVAAQPTVVPAERYPADGNGDDDAYNAGWNACRAAVLADKGQP